MAKLVSKAHYGARLSVSRVQSIPHLFEAISQSDCGLLRPEKVRDWLIIYLVPGLLLDSSGLLADEL